MGINGVLNSGVVGVKGTLRHLLSIRKEDRVAVDDALGRFLDSVVCETAAAAQEAIDYLKHVGKGRCRFLILERAPAAPAQEGWTAPGAQRVLEKISCEPQYLPLVTGLLSGVYASGGSVYGAFWVTGGVDEVVSNEPYWEEEGDLKEQIKKLDEESAALENEKVLLLPQLEGARAAADAAEDKAVALNIEFHKNATEAVGAEDGLRIKQESLALSRTELEKAEAGIRQAEADFAALVEAARAGAPLKPRRPSRPRSGRKRTRCTTISAARRKSWAAARPTWTITARTWRPPGPSCPGPRATFPRCWTSSPISRSAAASWPPARSGTAGR